MSSNPGDTEEAFQEVVNLDLDRILSRLRSCHAKITRKTAGERPLIEQLHDAIHSQSIRVTKTKFVFRRLPYSPAQGLDFTSCMKDRRPLVKTTG